MEASLFKGDLLFINKFTVGLNIPFTSNRIFQNIEISENDIITFHYPKLFDVPLRKKDIMVSRCVALPGDTFQIVNRNLVLDNSEKSYLDSAQFKYRISSKKSELSHNFFKQYGVIQYLKIHEAGLYDIASTKEKAHSIRGDKRIQNVRLLNRKKDKASSVIFPANQYYSFTKDNFGPVVVPYSGWNVPLNYRNIGLYKRVIEQYENNTILVRNDLVYLNSVLIDNYTFKKNYYFVLDDNRDYAHDSRHWGFLPEDHIIGVVIDI